MRFRALLLSLLLLLPFGAQAAEPVPLSGARAEVSGLITFVADKLGADIDKLPPALRAVDGELLSGAGAVLDLLYAAHYAKKRSHAGDGCSYSDAYIDGIIRSRTWGLAPTYCESYKAIYGGMLKLAQSPDCAPGGAIEGSWLCQAANREDPLQKLAQKRRREQQLQLGRELYGRSYHLPTAAGSVH